MNLQRMLFVAALGLGVSGPALADKLPKGTDHTPPVFVDESHDLIRVIKNYPGWGFKLEAVVANVSDMDHVRAVARQGGKVLGEAKCSVSAWTSSGSSVPRANVSCESKDAFKTPGATEVDLIDKDDKTDKEFLVRTYKLTVKNWKNYPANNKEKLWDAWSDDLNGPAWLIMDGNHQVDLAFWVNSDPTGNPTLRCNVDGKPLNTDHAIEGAWEGQRTASFIEQDARNAKGDTITYKQHNVNFNMRSLGWGTKEAIKSEGEVTGTSTYKDSFYFIDHPGKWECQLRQDQETLREFVWTVNKDGRVENDEMNQGKGAIPTLDTAVMIEMHIPKTDKLDDLIQPAQWKASFAFGLPWPDNAKVKKIQASWPAAGGSKAVPQ